MKTAFFAYPSANASLRQTILTAIDKQSGNRELVVSPWESLEIVGQHISSSITARLEGVDVFLADITFPNENVFFEIGFAIGRQKPTLFTLNSAFHRASADVSQLGLFDTFGYHRYENSDELAGLLVNPPTKPVFNEFRTEINNTQPLFVLESVARTDFMNKIVSSVKASRTHYRAFDPRETARFSAVHAIREVSQSTGVVLPLIGGEIIGSKEHNLRAAFLAGLANALGVSCLLIQLNEVPVPMDYRDAVTAVSHPDDIFESVKEFAQQALRRLQKPRKKSKKNDSRFLLNLNLGASAAENEFQDLDSYFVDTFEYRRALRGESALVVGRKGAGKTAIFFSSSQLNPYGASRKCCRRSKA